MRSKEVKYKGMRRIRKTRLCIMYKGLQRFVSPFKVNMNLTLVAVAAGVLLFIKYHFAKRLLWGII